MIETKEKFTYEAFGMKLASDISFPELARIHEETASPDIDIEIEVDFALGERLVSQFKPYEFAVNGNTVMFYVPDSVLFSIHAGKKIAVSPLNECDEDLIRLYLLGTCIGVLLMQRGVCPLHGSAVAINGKAYAFIGESGAGKSTLALAFLRRGYFLLSDDVLAVSLSGTDRTPYVTPSYPQQKLWKQSLETFGIERTSYRSIYGRETKYCIPMAEHYYDKPLPLAGMIELVKSSKPEEAVIRPIKGLKRLRTLYKHTYRQFLIPQMGLTPWHFQMSAAIADQIGMFQLKRVSEGFSAEQLVSLILDSVALEG